MEERLWTFNRSMEGEMDEVCPMVMLFYGQTSLHSRRLVRAGEERASLNKRLPKCLWQICSWPKKLRKSFPLVTDLVNGSNFARVSKICRLLMLSRKLFLIFQVFRLRNSVETRTEKVYYLFAAWWRRRLSRFFLRNTEKFDLSIIHFKYIGKSKLARAGIEYFL
jgi:hypothetical protein